MTEPAGKDHNIHILEVDEAGQRLDVFLSRALPEMTRSRVKGLIDQGLAEVDGRPAKASAKLKKGARVSLSIPPVRPLDLEPEAQNLEIIFEDRDLIVINKPAGVVVHPAPGHEEGTLVHGLLAHIPDLTGIGGVERPGIVHRLDKDTSGLLAVAKNEIAHQALSEAFKERRVEKTYLAVLLGRMPWPQKRVEAAIARHPVKRKKMTILEGGRAAISIFKLREELSGPLSLVEVIIETGRTHQIRVHAAHLGHPVAADPLYGSPGRERQLSVKAKQALAGVNRQMLHAWRLTLDHPRTGERLSLEAPWPIDLAGLVAAVKLKNAE